LFSPSHPTTAADLELPAIPYPLSKNLRTMLHSPLYVTMFSLKYSLRIIMWKTLNPTRVLYPVIWNQKRISLRIHRKKKFPILMFYLHIQGPIFSYKTNCFLNFYVYLFLSNIPNHWFLLNSDRRALPFEMSIDFLLFFSHLLLGSMLPQLMETLEPA
jgi:hypothetical protein